jgi:hypothetical protein
MTYKGSDFSQHIKHIRLISKKAINLALPVFSFISPLVFTANPANISAINETVTQETHCDTNICREIPVEVTKDEDGNVISSSIKIPGDPEDLEHCDTEKLNPDNEDHYGNFSKQELLKRNDSEEEMILDYTDKQEACSIYSNPDENETQQEEAIQESYSKIEKERSQIGNPTTPQAAVARRIVSTNVPINSQGKTDFNELTNLPNSPIDTDEPINNDNDQPSSSSYDFSGKVWANNVCEIYSTEKDTSYILKVGDSITHDSRYLPADQLEGIDRVDNIAYPGSSTYWFDRDPTGSTNPQDIYNFHDNIYQPSIQANAFAAVIMLGTNDCGGVEPSDYINRLSNIAKQYESNGIIPILSTIPPREVPCAVDFEQEYYDAISNLANENKWPLRVVNFRQYGNSEDLIINNNRSDLISEDQLKGDGIHISNYSTINQATSEIIKNLKNFISNNCQTRQVSQVLGAATSGEAVYETEESGVFSFFSAGEKVGETTVIVDEQTQKVIMKLFYDENGNGILDGNEKYLKEEALDEVDIKKEQEVEYFDLSAGWNTINLPGISTEITTAEDLLKEFKSQGKETIHLANFSAGKFHIFSIRENSSEFASNFSLIPGEGYFIFSFERGRVNFKHQPYDESVTLELSNGWNLVGINSLENDYTSNTLLATLNDKGFQADTVSDFDSGIYKSVIWADQIYYGQEFNIIQKKSYFIKVKSTNNNTNVVL